MKILQVIQDRQLRGAEIFCCQLSIELRRLGHLVDLAYLFDDSSELKGNFTELEMIAVEADRRKRLWDLRAWRRLAYIIRRGQYELVQANAGDTLKYVVLSKFFCRWRARVVFRNANKMSSFIDSWSKMVLNRWLLSRCKFIISVSENCREDLTNFLPRAQKFSVTIPIGTPAPEAVVSEAIDNSTRPLWISIAKFVPEKNHRFIIQLFNQFLQKHGAGQLWLVGDGPLLNEVKREVMVLGIESHVTFRGLLPDVRPALLAADLLILPSLIEGLPAVLLEAMSYGIPIVAAAVGGIPEIIHDGLTGYLIEGFNMRDYLEKIESVLQPEVRSRFAMNARAVSETYSLKKIARRFEETYHQIIKAGA